MAEGIRKRHSAECPAHSGKRCRCKGGFEAWVYSKREKKKIRRTFPSEGEAKTWRADAITAVARGGLRSPRPTTVEEAWEAWFAKAKVGAVTTRSGDPYKASALRSYGAFASCPSLPRRASLISVVLIFRSWRTTSWRRG